MHLCAQGHRILQNQTLVIETVPGFMRCVKTLQTLLGVGLQCTLHIRCINNVRYIRRILENRQICSLYNHNVSWIFEIRASLQKWAILLCSMRQTAPEGPLSVPNGSVQRLGHSKPQPRRWQRCCATWLSHRSVASLSKA